MKMETPKMDVVRFQEADVLAASPYASPVYLTGFADSKDRNGEVAFTHNGNSYLFKTTDYSDAASFANAVAGAGVANVSFNDSQDPDSHSLGGMYYADVTKNGESLVLPDGEYAWNPSKGVYCKQ